MQQINLAVTYDQEHKRWLKDEAPRRSVADWIGAVTPYFIIPVFLAAFAISAPHTVQVMHLLSPGWAWVMPILVEVGILVMAFNRKKCHQTGETFPPMFWLLWLLCFIVAVLTNFAAALATVVEQVHLENLSGSQLVEQFGLLPVITQSGLIMVVVAAIVVPVAAEVTGHGIANLTYDSKRSSPREQAWHKVQIEKMYRRVYDDLYRSGQSPQDARQNARALVSGYFGQPMEQPVQLPKPTPPPAIAGSVRGSKRDVQAYISEHPEAIQMSINDLRGVLFNQGVQVSRTTVQSVLSEAKQSAPARDA